MNFGNSQFNGNQFCGNIFNQQYVSQSNYMQHRSEIARYQANQNIEVGKVVKAMHDLCEAAKKLDAQHYEQAMILCLAEIAREYGW